MNYRYFGNYEAKLGNKSDEAMRFNFFAGVKRFISSLLKFFAVINVLLLHRFPNLPPVP
jgi:hypothetical protein